MTKNHLFVFILLLAYVCSGHAASPVKILILSGNNNHEWQLTTPFIQDILNKSGLFAADFTNRPDTLNTEMLNAYKVILSNWNAFPEQADRWNPEAKQALANFIRKGGGFVCIHAASAAHYDWQEYLQITGGRWGDKTHHGPIGNFKVRISNTKHPITKRIKDFEIKDELWVDLECDPAAEVLCVANATEYADTPDKSEPVALVSHYGKGRGFYLVLGHDIRAMANADWQNLLLRGTQWVAKKKLK